MRIEIYSKWCKLGPYSEFLPFIVFLEIENQQEYFADKYIINAKVRDIFHLHVYITFISILLPLTVSCAALESENIDWFTSLPSLAGSKAPPL